MFIEDYEFYSLELYLIDDDLQKVIGDINLLLL